MGKYSPIMRSTPSYHLRPWGGGKLGKPPKLGVGESWEISLLSEGPSTYLGQPLDKLVDESKIPYLVKFLNTADYLSVQVHPDDAYAMKNAKSRGKTECWAVTEAGEKAGIYLGVKEGVTSELFFKTLQQKGQPTDLMNFFSVKVGDFFYVPAGTLHAIGKDLTLIEVQQSCGVTYRVWDWNRVDAQGKGRELHLSQAKDVSCFEREKNNQTYFRHRQNIFSGSEKKLVEHSDFILRSFALKMGEMMTVKNNKNRFSSIIVANGKCEINRENHCEIIGPYESVILPSGFDHARLIGKEACYGVIVD